MIVTYNWLKEYVDFDFSPEDLAARLTMAGLEVDALEKLGEGLDDVVVARLLDVHPHPDADRLTVCAVDDGTGQVQVVCGAKNHRSGDLVALARVGAVLPGDFKIKKSKIRGQVSMGMLCSRKELGLPEESDGIMILPAGLEVGRPVFEALGLKDVRFELGLTPNRPDCLSVLGVAREVSAMAGSPLRLPSASCPEEGGPIGAQTSVAIEDPERCPRYAARLIRGVTIGPSPEWLRLRLESVGQRSINNVVDVTNLVLMELGHPLHAFDFKALRGGRIVVRVAAEGSRFTTLDGQVRELGPEDLTICDGEGPVALAGIMGGENSEIQPDTVDILLESAYFQPRTIRRTSKRLGMHTESSHRFERGADIGMVPVALERAASLILEVAGGEVARGVLDVYPRPVPPVKLVLGLERTRKLLGIELSEGEVARLLRGIGLETEPAAGSGDESLVVTIPSFRPDLEREVDLIEEVARLHGYDHFPVTMPSGRAICQPPAPERAWRQRLGEALVGEGFSEVINYSFVSPEQIGKLLLPSGDSRLQTLALLNPLSEEQSVMRTTLVPSLLETARRNLSYRLRDLSLFELRRVFRPQGSERLPEEPWRLAALRTGRREPLGWAQDDAEVDFFDLKGAIANLLDLLHISPVQWEADSQEAFLHPGKSCRILREERLLGVLGEVHPQVLRDFDLDQPVLLADLDVDALLAEAAGGAGFRPLSRFPDVFRDTAFLVDAEVPARRVLDILDAVKVRDVEDVVLFDLYQGAGIPEGKKSLAIRVRYRSADRTLTDEEINARHGKLVEALTRGVDAQIR